jgi:hypothetical protein
VTGVLALALVVAVAVTLRGGDVFVGGWQGPLAWVVAWLPPTGATAARFAVAFVVAAALLRALAAWARRGPCASPERIWLWRPLLWGALAVVPFLPWLPDMFPGLLVFAGPMLWVLLGGALLAGWWDARASFPSMRLSGWRPRTAALFIGSLVVYSVLGLALTSRHGLRGDEPHYLVVVESLLRDGDLRVENNYAAAHYRSFVPEGPLSPHAINRGRDGVMYSIHAPGLPIVTAPAYALAGRAGANLVIALLAAGAGLAVFLLARSLSGPAPALLTWLAVCGSTPWLMHGWLIFPEMAAACVAAWSVWWLWKDGRATTLAWLGRGCVLGVLPWFHAKFSVLLAGLAIALVLGRHLWRAPRTLTAFVLPMVLSVAAWLLAFHAMYGVPDPTMPYGGLRAMTDLAWSNVPRGLLGLFFDQEFGLLVHAPVYGLAAFGVRPLLRDPAHRRLAFAVFGVGLAYLVGVTRYYMWWGGLSVPARFLVPVLPLLAPVLAAAFGRLRECAWGRAVMAVMLGVSLTVSALLVFEPGWTLLFNTRDGTGNLLALVQGAGAWTRVFPSLWDLDWTAQVPRVAAVIGGVAVGVLATRAAARTRGVSAAGAPGRGGHLAMVFVATSLLALAVFTRVGLTQDARAKTALDGQLRLLAAWGPDGWMEPSRLRALSARALLQRVDMALFSRDEALPVEPPGDPSAWMGPLPLPPGLYDVRVSGRREARAPGAPGDLGVRLADADTVLGSVPLSDGLPLVLRVEVPGPGPLTRVLVGVSHVAAVDHIGRVTVQPVALASTGHRAPGIRHRAHGTGLYQ